MKNPFWRAIYLCVLFIVLTNRNLSAQEHDSTKDDGTIPVEVSIREDDYLSARKIFTTKLMFEKHAPQKWDTVNAPEGIDEIYFLFGENSLRAWINIPSDTVDKKYPVVIFLHGGFSFGMEDWEMCNAYRDSGFIVMTPIFRGENGQAGSFTLFYNETDDVTAAAEFIRGKNYVDKDRIFISGHSTGGTLSMLASMSADIFRAGVSFSGSPDQKIFCKYGIPAEIIPFDTNDVKEFEMRSPLSFAKSFKCPFRIFYGSDEPHFKLSSEQTSLTAESIGLNVKSIEIEGDHFSALPEEIRLSISFFNGFK